MKLSLKDISLKTRMKMHQIAERTLKENELISYILNKTPLPNQLTFLTYPTEELLYGGMAGGGKSEALLLAALQYVEEKFIPEGENRLTYDALILRRSLDDLEMPNAILDRAKQWLLPLEDTGLVYYKDLKKKFTFSSGATLTFRYLAHNNDLMKYQGAELQYIGFDELTQFPENQYQYLHSRLRKTEDNPIPLRMRAGTNPGGRGNDWVKKKFITGNVPFVPASYLENKYLDQEDYTRQLEKLDPLTKQQLMYGSWDAYAGNWLLITVDDFENSLRVLPDDKLLFSVVGVDSASTGQDKFACTLISLYQTGLMWLSDMVATRKMNQEEILFTFLEQHHDKNIKLIAFEREPGSDSTFAKKYWQGLLPEYNVVDFSPQGSKFVRARPVGQSIREKRLFINKDIEESLINELRNQFGYIHPLKEKMKEYPSPDLLDSTDYAHMGVMKILENKTRVTIL